MDSLFEEIVGLSGFVMVMVELFKPGIERIGASFNLSDEAKGWLTQFVSVLIGIFAVFGGGERMNLFAGSEIYGQYTLFGLIVTGTLVGLGSKYIHAAWQLIYRKPVPPPTVIVEAESSPSWGEAQSDVSMTTTVN